MTDDLAARVERLERENRRFKRWAAVGVLLLGGAVLLGQAAPERVHDVVQARDFQLLDAQGRSRGGMSVGSDGSLGLNMFDQAGAHRVVLGLSPSGAPMLVLHASTKEGGGASLALLDDGRAALFLDGRDARGSSLLGCSADGSPYLSLTDRAGTPRAQLGLNERLLPSLVILDSAGRSRAVLTLADGGAPFLELYDEDGVGRATLGATDLVMPKTGASVRTAESSLVLTDRSRTVVYRAP